MPKVYVSIGSNVEPERHVRYALGALRERFGELDVSPVYRTAAVGFEGDDFLNLAVGFATDEAVEAVDAALDAIEASAGRDRDAARFAPRTLDLDLLLYGDAVIDAGGIRVPRKEITRYAFMLRPLADIAGDFRHPQTGETMLDLLRMQDFSRQRCEPAAFDTDWQGH
ncbi:MAG TPA: 2-amino-4-hydroxy-6-hydroxymethyldihydropteridine diphosphokinase [Gammaproteobacteria bacterium]